jgi:CubicO group peptidase (beta-lactamase class C family)
LLSKKVKSKEVKLLNGYQVSTLDAIRFWMGYPLEFAPGKDYKYASGFELLAGVIEKASGMRCDEFVEQTVLQPLKITSGINWCYEGSRAKYEEFSRKHRFFGYGYNKEKNAYEWAYGDVVLGNSRQIFGWNIGGGFWCLSIVDLLRFVTLWPTLFRYKSLVSAAITDQTPDNSFYGYGFSSVRGNIKEPMKWGHGGSLGGIKAGMRFNNKTNISGAELWSSHHPRRRETVKIADKYIESCIKNGRIKRMKDLWPIY